MHKPLITMVSAAVLAVLGSGAAHSAAFSLYTESNGAAIGNYAAGIAAEAADASTGWYNPAGLTMIHQQQIVGGGVGVFPIVKLNGTSTYTTTGLPNYVESFNGLQTDKNGFVPSFHYALPLTDKVTFGLSVISPFGLATEWNPASPVRYQATFSELLTTNLSPEFGAELTDRVSIGAGLDLQYARVKFNRMLGAPTVFNVLSLNPTTVDSLSYNKGSSKGVGFHAGLMTFFNDKHTRLGLNYQSRVRHTFYGNSRFTGPMATNTNLFGTAPAGAFYSGNLFSDPVEFPDILTLSAYHDLNEKFALLGSVLYSGWGVFKTIQLNNVAAAAPTIATGITQVYVNSTSPQNYRNAWRVAVGANYHVNPLWMMRVGAGYDQTPTNNVDRDVRLPDTDKWALSVGTHYQVRPNVGVDLGYTHLFHAKDVQINRSDRLGTSSSFTVNANGTASADLVGAQFVWTLDRPEIAATK